MASDKRIEIKNTIIGCLDAGSITVEEREIALLIDAARQRGILTKAERYGSTPYFELTLGEDEKKHKYLVCFGCDPDREAYPHAERALRASRFVDGLLRIVNSTYNCYAAVPERIEPPSRSTVLRRVFGGAADIALGGIAEQSRGEGDEMHYRTAYELEMVVTVAFGSKYERINECVTVELDAQDNATYTYGSITQKTASGNMPLTEKQKKESIWDANRIRDKVQMEGEKKKILMALSAAEDSRFRRFMDSLDDKDSRFIGQADIQPCFVFVDAIPERTFLYDVKCGGNEGEGLLRITWNKEPHKFDSAPLYIRTVHEDGQVRFHGLTHSPKGETDAEGELAAFDPNEALVPVYHYDARRKEALLVGISPLLDESDAATGVYKGMTDWAVPVDGISEKLIGDGKAEAARGYRYYRSETVMVGEKRYLKADVMKCAYTGNPTWRGDLTADDENFLDANGEFAKGRIDRTLIRDKNKRFCTYCGKGKNSFVFFADDERYERYGKNKKYLLWDGTCKCPQCKEGVLITDDSSAKRKLITAYNPTESESRQVFAYWDNAADAPAAVPAGNIYRCAHSNRYIYFDKTFGASQYVPCDTCGRLLSPKSYQDLLKNVNMRQVNGKLYCRSCLSDMHLYRDVYLPGGQKGVLVDAKQNPASLITCECGKLLYKQAQGFPRCECDACASDEQGDVGQHKKIYLCSSCWSNRPRSKFLKKRLCDDCADYERLHESALREERKREKDARQQAGAILNQKQELEQRYKTLAAKWEQTVWESMEKYLPYLGFADALYVRRARKKWRTALRAAQDAVKRAEDNVESLNRRMQTLESKDGADGADDVEVRRLQAELDAAIYELNKARQAVVGKKHRPGGVLAVQVPEGCMLEEADPKHRAEESDDAGKLYLSFTLQVMRGGTGGRKYEFLYENGKVTYVEVRS